uniref:Uncharacterized protein n=1 Tax=Solanum tuberosum TaxID=4113 RepID=M1DH44_SOLTU
MGVKFLKLLTVSVKTSEAGFLPPRRGRCSGMGAVVARQTRLKVTKNKRNESGKGRIKFLKRLKLVSRASSSGY